MKTQFKKLKKSFTALCIALIYVMNVNAQTIALNNWNGTTNSNWFTASNWSDGVPTVNSSVIISTGATNMPVINAAGAFCGNITINSGATLTMNASGELN